MAGATIPSSTAQADAPTKTKRTPHETTPNQPRMQPMRGTIGRGGAAVMKGILKNSTTPSSPPVVPGTELEAHLAPGVFLPLASASLPPVCACMWKMASARGGQGDAVLISRKVDALPQGLRVRPPYTKKQKQSFLDCPGPLLKNKNLTSPPKHHLDRPGPLSKKQTSLHPQNTTPKLYMCAVSEILLSKAYHNRLSTYNIPHNTCKFA